MISRDESEDQRSCVSWVQVSVDGGSEDDYLRQFWRGRMSMSKEDQSFRFENPKAPQEEDFFEGSTSEGSSSDSSSSSSS